jgi:hypothetical protein
LPEHTIQDTKTHPAADSYNFPYPPTRKGFTETPVLSVRRVHEGTHVTTSDPPYAREGAPAPRAHTKDSEPPELPRDAGIRRLRGAPGFVDRYDRDAAACRANEALALRHADDLVRIWNSLDAGELLLGREVGHAKLLNRLELSARSMVIVATRDREWADALELIAEWDEAREAERAGSTAVARAGVEGRAS